MIRSSEENSSLSCTKLARHRRNTWIFFGTNPGDKRFDIYIDNLIGVIDGAKDEIVRQKLFYEKEFDKVIASFESWRKLPDATLWYAVSWAEGIRR